MMPDDHKRAPEEGNEENRDAPRPAEDSPPKRMPPGVQHGIADADKVARTGSKDEPVRNTPPAGAWNDVSGD
jgi:hypothetical protein